MLHWIFFQKLWVNKSRLRHILHPIFPKTSFPKFPLEFLPKIVSVKSTTFQKPFRNLSTNIPVIGQHQKRNQMVSFQIYWVAVLCCKINSKWLHSRLEKQQILILLQRGDITSAMSVIKNCDDWYYQTLEIQKHSVTKRENHKSMKTQENDVFVQQHYFCQVTDREITTLDWSQKCNDLSNCRRPTILQNNVSTRSLIGWQHQKNIEDKHHCLRRRAQ